jgi:hypothetical protein
VEPELPDEDATTWLLPAQDVVVEWEQANNARLLSTRQAGDLTRRIACALAYAFRAGRRSSPI